jgi:murein DD-endopeptidase MepM/ murein hydrolase activator NlpD
MGMMNSNAVLKFALPMRFKSLTRLIFMVVLAATVTNESSSAQQLTASDTSEVRFLNSRKFFLYKVAKSETLYGISKKFNIPQDEIIELNPELNDGLKNKMTIWIPAYSRMKKNPIEVAETVKPLPAPKGEEQLDVVILSSLELAKVYVGEVDSTDSTRVYEPVSKQIQSNLQFVEGTTLALEKFHTAHTGFRLRSTFIDTENDTLALNKIAWKFRSADVWITNENGPVLEYLNRLSLKNGVQLVSCGINTSEIIRKNPNAIAMLPSSLLQCEKMGMYAAKKFHDWNAIFIKTASAKENDRMKAFKNGWSETAIGAIKTIDFSKSGAKGLVDSLYKSKPQVIFISTSNEDMLTNLLVALKDAKDEYRFTLIGLPTWLNFETVDPQLLEKCNTFVFNSGMVNYDSKEVLDFRQTFRDKYATEPAEPAFIAFDAATAILNGRKKFGKDFITEKDYEQIQGLFTDYHFVSNAQSGSAENSGITVWTFSGLVPVRVTP